MSYTYLASPYSTGTGTLPVEAAHRLMQERYEATLHALAELMSARRIVYSPIVHCHVVAERYVLPRVQDFWREHNRVMLRGAGELMILRLDGWQASEGVAFERWLASRKGIPITYYD